GGGQRAAVYEEDREVALFGLGADRDAGGAGSDDQEVEEERGAVRLVGSRVDGGRQAGLFGDRAHVVVVLTVAAHFVRWAGWTSLFLRRSAGLLRASAQNSRLKDAQTLARSSSHPADRLGTVEKN